MWPRWKWGSGRTSQRGLVDIETWGAVGVASEDGVCPDGPSPNKSSRS